ncbi:hypothetical protein [Paenibacillus validus]|uniref:Serine/threonine protein phosphatase n=1 Tax=Paenibacillus validus TaxID=44253 RepID=A0A7X2ZFQ0_9BACL|nr:hypothetical protein [Paenibacillus validus]MUG74031.1 hypothetical protein [Paenibacillus validus]
MVDKKEYPFLKYTSFGIGGFHTIRSFCSWYQVGTNDEKMRKYIKEYYSEEINFLRELPNFWEDDRHIYVHGGIDPAQNDWKLTSNKNFRWIRERFHRNDGKLPTNKTIVFGHEICSRLHKDDTNFNPWFGRQIIGIDGGIKYGKQLNALIIDDNGQYQSESILAS